jgi:ketosteroid isomerase-like protein
LSEETVELVRRYYAALPGLRAASPDDDPALLDRMLRDYLDEAVEIHMPPEYPEGEQVLRGREGAAKLVATLREAWAEWRFEPERLIDVGNRVVVLVRVVGEGGASGVPLELRTAHVWTVRNGRMTSAHLYRDRAEALEAAGLRE